jgi:hypothetical protein
MGIDPHTLSFLIRSLHVAAMAILLGGALLLWASASGLGHSEPGASIGVAVSYEGLAWLALGLLVMTGIGNLAALGPALPPPQTSWGQRFLLKLALVALLIVGSLLRTLLVVRLAAEPANARGASGWALLRAAYAGTAGLAALVLLVAVALAHG